MRDTFIPDPDGNPGDGFHIRSNRRPRPLIAYAELTDKERREFDYLDREEYYSNRFFRYLGSTYDSLDGFIVAVTPFREHGWSGYMSDSFFSGILVQQFDEFGEYMDEDIIVGRYWH